MNEHTPIIVVGMHRSGTSVLIKMLEKLGLFVGHKLDENYEALFFLKLNNWLMRQCGGAWDNPTQVGVLANRSEARKFFAHYLDDFVKSPKIASYLGLKNYLKYGSLEEFSKPWGWKDPRNSITLPLWLEIFPNAKIINICRNGIDVANSLRVRASKDIYNSKDIRQVFGKGYWLLPSQYYLRQNFSLSCLSLKDSFTLWETYFDVARTQSSQSGNPYLEIRYEDFLAKPFETLEELARFCDLQPDDGLLASLLTSIDKRRAFAFVENPELVTFARSVEERLNQRGYQIDSMLAGVG